MIAATAICLLGTIALCCLFRGALPPNSFDLGDDDPCGADIHAGSRD